MARGELFEVNEIKRCRTNLTLVEREQAIRKIIKYARMGIQYFYTLRETCAILHCSYDELNTILYSYRLDAVLFLSVYRVPWYDLAGYLIDDEDDDLEEALDEYLQAIARRNLGETVSA